MGGGHAEGNIGALLHHVHPGSGLPSDPAAKSDAGVANNARHQMRNLTSQSPVIRKLVNEGKVAVAAGVFSLETGEVTWF
jgi:carbonic anhydrase